MSKSTLRTLSKGEIDEELLNNELINSGGVENEELLKEMNIEEKKDMLWGIKQSKDEFYSEPNTRSLNEQPAFDASAANFPSLTYNNGKGLTRGKLKLPRRLSSGTKTVDCDGSTDKYINLLDDESLAVKFNLPFCINDDAPPLEIERPIRNNKNAYYVMKGETPGIALKRMLSHHDKWKDAYTAEISKIESHAEEGDIENCDSREHNSSPKSDKVEDKENDPYSFFELDSPVRAAKVYNGPRKRETNANSEGILQQSSRQSQRKTSRDSDCEEIETILKSEEPKASGWQQPRTRSKRNRKQLFNHEKNQGCPEVEFEFENKWDSSSTTWSAPQPPSSSCLNNQIQTRQNLSNTSVLEEKVQCPICQRSFVLSKVENHAATCEGYSDSPMDVEEEN